MYKPKHRTHSIMSVTILRFFEDFVSSLSPEDASLSRSKSAISTNSPSVIFLTSLHGTGG